MSDQAELDEDKEESIEDSTDDSYSSSDEDVISNGRPFMIKDEKKNAIKRGSLAMSCRYFTHVVQ